MEEEEYEFFVHQWETYKVQANLTQNSKQHLESCLGNGITVILYRRLSKEGLGTLTKQGLLDHIKEVFVKRHNRVINRVKLWALKQCPDQPVKQYVGSLKQMARICQFSMSCSSGICNQKTDYS